MSNLQTVIITGMSGAGKTVAMQCFEDMGYYCIDNLPPSLIPTFIELFDQTQSSNRVALVVDLRSSDFFEDFSEIVEENLKDLDTIPKILFLDASNRTLVARYKESRRSHPLSTQGRIMDGILKERALLEGIKGRSDIIIDTTNLNSRGLRKRIIDEFNVEKEETFHIDLLSFGFKHGTPLDADLLIDVRFLPNPHYIDELRPQTGLDDEVYEYVMSQPDTELFYEKYTDLLDFLLPRYKLEGKASVTIAIGCTGGKHRSVALTERIAQKYEAAGYIVNRIHRDKDKE